MMGDKMGDELKQEAARPLVQPGQAAAQQLPHECPEVDAEVLMQGCRELQIIHNGDRYRLRVTSNEKLILTK